MSKSPGSRTSALGLGAVGALLFVLAAACGGSSAKAASTTSTTASTRAGAAGFAAYRTCLGQHGINLPPRTRGTGGTGGGGFGGGGFGGGGFGGTPRSLPKGVTASQFAAAQKACASKLPAGGSGRFGGGQAFQAYASCLRDHGVTISSVPRGTSPTTAVGTPRPTFNRNDPKFVAANKVCRALLPNRTTTTTAG
jgi:hypothetical protein